MKFNNQEKVWDSIAEQWFHFRQQKNVNVEYFFNKYCKNKSEKGSVLDIGCGNSRNLLNFAKSNFKCYGIDFSQKMIEYSKEFIKKHNIEVNLKKANMLKIPFKDNYFDYTLMIASLHHIEKDDQLKALKELKRVLKQKGTSIISVWNKQSENPYTNWKVKDKIYKRYYYFFKEQELKDLILKAGFKILENYTNKNIVFIVEKVND
ncbi:MAG: class I SAM-dependent methyltransferase [archaeon]